MDRIDGADFVDLGGGKNGFRSQNKSAGIAGTEVTDDWLNGIQEELLAVIQSEEIIPSKAVWTQLLEALTKKIEAVRVAMPIFPTIFTTDFKLPVTYTAPGNIRIAANTEFSMRGRKPYKTVQTDLATAANKTYHLRWDVTNGWRLRDLANNAGIDAYNPTLAAETTAVFDSDYDNMLAARVITNGANVATVLPLANNHLLTESSFITGASGQLLGANAANFLVSKTLNWARTPTNSSLELAWRGFTAGLPDHDYRIVAQGGDRSDAQHSPIDYGLTRYALAALVMCDGASEVTMRFNARG